MSRKYMSSRKDFGRVMLEINKIENNNEYARFYSISPRGCD